MFGNNEQLTLQFGGTLPEIETNSNDEKNSDKLEDEIIQTEQIVKEIKIEVNGRKMHSKQFMFFSSRTNQNFSCMIMRKGIAT